MVAATEAAPPQGEQPKGLFGRILGGGSSQKQFKKAKMGLENKFYYNKEVSCASFDQIDLLTRFSNLV